MLFFDSHAHIADERFDEDRESVLLRMQAGGVAKCTLSCDPTDEPERVALTLSLARENAAFFCTMGLHPHNARCWGDAVASAILETQKMARCVAVGEIGLDYHYDLSPRDSQREAFAAQLEMAYALGKPAVLHIREAFGDAMDLLTAAQRAGRLPLCEMHCYSGSWEIAKQCLSMGMYLSFSGSVTFKNASKLLDTAMNMPLERMLIETDCPYLSPEPMRGRRNEPAHVAHTCARVAALRGMEAEELAKETYANACRFFGISEGAKP